MPTFDQSFHELGSTPNLSADTLTKQRVTELCFPNSTLPHLKISEFRFSRGIIQEGGNFGALPILQIPVDKIVISSSLDN